MESEIKQIKEDVNTIKKALLGDPFDPSINGLVHQVGENTKDIKSIKKGHWKKLVAASGVGVAAGGAGSSKLAALAAKIASIFSI